MLIALEARNRAGALLSLPLDDVSDGIIVESIEGLDPVKATLVSSSFAALDGAHYQSSRREPRNIKITLGMEPEFETESVRDIRNRIYSFFMPKSEVRLSFRQLDGQVVDISGRVESCDTPLFVKEPQVVISMLCFDPDFVDLTPVVHDYATSGNTTDEAGKLVIDYDGTVETGFLLTLLLNRHIFDFIVYHRPPDGTLRTLYVSHAFDNSDVFKVNTQVGEKSAIRTRNGVDSSILYALSPQSSWLELQPGVNVIRVYTEGAAIPYNIRYTNKYGGL